jgi:hypothetical protein
MSTYAYIEDVANNPACVEQDMNGFDIINAGTIETGLFSADDIIAKSFIGVGGPVGTVRLTAVGSDPQIYNLPITEGTAGQFLGLSGTGQMTWVTGNPTQNVDTLNGLVGAVTLASSDSSVSITPSGQTINLTTSGSTVNGEGGALTLAADNGATLTTEGKTFTVSVDNPVPAGLYNDQYPRWNAYTNVWDVSSDMVRSLNAVSGDLVLYSSDNSINISGDLDLTVANPIPANIVNTLNGQTGDVTLTSNTLTITDVNLEVTYPNAAGVNGGDYMVWDGTNYVVSPAPVIALQNLSKNVSLVSETLNITTDPLENTISLEVSSGVTSILGLTGAVDVTSSDNSLIVTGDIVTKTLDLVGQNLTDGSGIAVEGGRTGTINIKNYDNLLTKLGVYNATPTVTSVQLTQNNQVSAIVPDSTPPTPTTTQDGVSAWLYTKPVGLTGFNWYSYNPRYTNPSAPLTIPKTGLQTLWAVVNPVVNIYTAGVLALNIYSYDVNHPPTSGFYNTRWAYSNTGGAVAGTTGVNLFANRTYLIHAFDVPRTQNALGVGFPNTQTTGLRDPYDIYPDIPHIPLQNVVVAFNPDNQTNFITWTTTTAFTTGQTCIFNTNGIFYTAVQNSTNQLPVSVAGVPNTAYWTPINPQPSNYSTKPILTAGLFGTAGNQGGWGAGSLLRVLAIGYSTATESISYTLQ